MNKYAGVALIAVTVMFDLVVENGEKIEDVLTMMSNLVKHPAVLNMRVVDVVGPSGWPVIELSGSVEDVEAFLGVNDFQMEW